MKDFDLAKKLYELRVSHGYSQNELATMLGVTNKAISKWENANAEPTLRTLKKLSSIYEIKIDDFFESDKNNEKQIYKIVITGGPCSGKSTALSWLQTEFTKKGYRVLFVPETASELILGGICPWTIDSNTNYESYIIKLQLEKERIFEEAARHVKGFNKVLIVCDRGVLDCKAYTTKAEFKNIMKQLGTSEVLLRDSYDAVFHLVTAAIGAKEFYTLENNKARLETVEESIEKDELTLHSWTGHPHLRVIDNSTNFELKMRRLMAEISNFLGEPQPYEIERKFLIEYPDLDKLEKLPNCERVEIIQTYLKSKNGETRIRQRGLNGNYTYTKTTKQHITNSKRLEYEERISKDEYLTLLLDADTSMHQIRKNRYCLIYKNQYFEIDVYPFWKDKAIMEIELIKENQKIDLPKNINVIKEVTDEEEYSNYYIAKHF
jgi:CYTH domain-containing protein/transcriptional regulator with XRE-family HTH domain